MKLSKTIITSKLFIKFIIIILFVTSLLTIVYFYKNDEPKCVNPYEVKDSSSGKEIVRICGNTLYRGNIKVVGENEYPDLFEFLLNKDSKPDIVKQYVRVFEVDKQEYVSMKSVIDYISWNNSSIGIYRKEGNKYALIFKKAFSDNPGRWVNIEFGEDYTSKSPSFYLSSQGDGISISGDLGYLGCTGACRILWWDFYDWDSNKKTFVLANNKHVENFKKILANYEEMDKTTCFSEVNISESISNLYPIRKDKEKICSDDAEQPYTTIKQAEMLLKGKKAIELIINGENIPMSQVDKVKIDF